MTTRHSLFALSALLGASCLTPLERSPHPLARLLSPDTGPAG